MSDRIAVIDKGRIAQLDRPEALYRRPRSLFVADFIGESVLLPLQRDGAVATLQGRPLHPAEALPSAGGLQLMIRPELLLLDPPEDGAHNLIMGTVGQAIYQGDSILLLVDVGEGREISVRLPASRAAQGAIPEQGHVVRLGLHRDDAVVLPEDPA